MRSISIVFVLSGLFASLHVSIPLQTKETVTAKGIVTNPGTGDPVPGAAVRFTAANQSPRTLLYTATTGDDGRFTVERMVPGRYRVLVEKAGFITPRGFAEDDAIGLGRHVTVASGDVPTNLIRLSLIRVSSVSGRVLDADGSPLGPITVTLLEKGYNSLGKPQLVPRGRTLTNDKGEYEITRLQPGEYYIRVESFLRRTENDVRINGSDFFIPLTYYPGFTAIASAVPVRLSDGINMGGIDVRITASPVFSVKMKLESASELPPPTFRVGDIIDSLVIDRMDGGVYVLRNLSPGEYDIDILFLRPTPGYSHRIHVAIVDQDIDLKTVNVDSQVSISGRVVVPTATVLPKNVILRSVSGGSFVPAAVEQDGTFHLQKVSQGEYIVELSSGQYVVQSVRYSGRDVPGSLLIDEPASGPLEITVDGVFATVEGVVQDSRNEAVGFGRVVLIPQADRRTNPNLFLTAVTDENGRFSIETVPPGNYSVLAWQYTPAYAYKNVEFLDSFIARANPVELKSGSKNSLNIRVISPNP